MCVCVSWEGGGGQVMKDLIKVMLNMVKETRRDLQFQYRPKCYVF